MEEREGNIFGLLADVLEYPTAGIPAQAKACRDALANRNRQAGKHMGAFAEFCTTTPAGSIEELYIDTFDLDAVCCPYVGFHLFGEDRARGAFMVRLKEQYRANNFPLGSELPDHISVMLRFLGSAQGDAERDDLVSYCLIPAAKKMISLFEDSGNPYRGVVVAVLLTLEQERGSS